jgi:ADP-heptose:LPS heptosyltransferase
MRIGLVWAGRPDHSQDHWRSMRLADFAPLADARDAEFVSLQEGPAAQQAASSPFPITDLSSSLKNFADTAAAIARLDLVISVDTSVAHLAGALGCEVWTLLHHVPDWRWMLDREDSPWYPTMRLFRQKNPGDWGEVMLRVREALKSRAN